MRCYSRPVGDSSSLYRHVRAVTCLILFNIPFKIRTCTVLLTNSIIGTSLTVRRMLICRLSENTHPGKSLGWRARKNIVTRFPDTARQHYQDKHPSLSKTGEADLINTLCQMIARFVSVLHTKCLGIPETAFSVIDALLAERHSPQLREPSMMDIKYRLANGWNTYWTSFVISALLPIPGTTKMPSRHQVVWKTVPCPSYQQNIVLSDTVWLDETYYKVRSNDIVLTTAGKRMRGISANQLCIGVACDNHRTVCIWEGNDHPKRRPTKHLRTI